MVFKSKLFWISVILVICAVIFIAVTYYHGKRLSEPIIFFNGVQNVPFKKQQLSDGVTKTKESRYNTPEEMDKTGTIPTNLSENSLGDTIDIHDESYDQNIVDEQTTNLQIVDHADTETEAEDAYVIQQVAELRSKISHALQERIRLYDLIYDLSDFGMDDKEPYELRLQIQKEANELRKTIFNLCDEYILYTMDDSLFQPDGEFYDLMEQNRISVSLIGLTLEEVKKLR